MKQIFDLSMDEIDKLGDPNQRKSGTVKVLKSQHFEMIPISDVIVNADGNKSVMTLCVPKAAAIDWDD